jgi:hypothetical protein
MIRYSKMTEADTGVFFIFYFFTDWLITPDCCGNYATSHPLVTTTKNGPLNTDCRFKPDECTSWKRLQITFHRWPNGGPILEPLLQRWANRGPTLGQLGMLSGRGGGFQIYVFMGGRGMIIFDLCVHAHRHCKKVNYTFIALWTPSLTSECHER